MSLYQQRKDVEEKIGVFKVTGGKASVERVTGHTIHVHTAKGGDPKQGEKISALKEAVGQLVKPGGYSDFPKEIHAYLHQENTSLGYAFQESPNGALKAALFLGSSVLAYHEYAEMTRNNPAEPRGGLSPTGQYVRLVSDQVYDYYKTTRTISAKSKLHLTNMFHELGHVIHQYRSTSDYFTLAQEHNDIHLGSSIRKDALVAKHEPLLKFGYRTVSCWAGQHNMRGGVLEYVAEVFAGLMMDVPFCSEVLIAYAGLGGPLPPQKIRHRRTSGRDWPYPAKPFTMLGE